jgi:mRNA interferase RelE/StbE
VKYRVDISANAQRSMRKIPKKDQERLLAAMTKLGDDPRPRGTVKMEGEERSYRIRVGVYRVVYDIFDDVLIIEIVRVGHRQGVY